MNDEKKAMISIDTKHNTIHIHHPTYRALGEPKIIQLLVDPKSQTLIILCPDKETPGGQELRVNHNKKYCDLCSKALISKIQETNPMMNQVGSYRLQGVVNEKQHLAVFPMAEMKYINHGKELNIGE